MEAALRVIEEWGRSKSRITHLIFSPLAGIDMPGADYQLIMLLGCTIGAEPDVSVEPPLFQILSASQTIIPDSNDGIEGHLREMGLTVQFSRNVTELISRNIGKCLVEAFGPIATRHGRNGNGNMGGPTVFFILEEVRRRFSGEKKTTIGKGMEWGVLIGLGAGVTLDAVVMYSVPVAEGHSVLSNASCSYMVSLGKLQAKKKQVDGLLMDSVETVREAKRTLDPATILAIRTTNPANCIFQADYPDYYFRVTERAHD
ncbi:unnamed protein product [Dovyalis caffra]|uniref:Uncharacterized protein n=1 Tax=Dovyalis caffra TaxID=77055 RepID=A0AAV1S9J1_9ROSI|nr:unnamed protein product [Dovyalis caffra]